MSVWVIKVTFYNSVTTEVNLNEGYKTYEKAKAAVLKKIESENLKIEDEYSYYDLDKQIRYELKLVTIFD